MHCRWSFVFFTVFVLLALTAAGEYRVYELAIDDVESGKSRTVISTLDHWQYPTYYPLGATETIRYVDSWMCWENTSRRRPCQRMPATAEPAQAPAPVTNNP